jgi:hypothetical protein
MSYLYDAPDPVLGEPPIAAARGPIFDLVCAPGACAPFADNQCRAVLRRAILDAIALATNAADKLSAENPDPKRSVCFVRSSVTTPRGRSNGPAISRLA